MFVILNQTNVCLRNLFPVKINLRQNPGRARHRNAPNNTKTTRNYTKSQKFTKFSQFPLHYYALTYHSEPSRMVIFV